MHRKPSQSYNAAASVVTNLRVEANRSTSENTHQPAVKSFLVDHRQCRILVVSLLLWTKAMLESRQSSMWSSDKGRGLKREPGQGQGPGRMREAGVWSKQAQRLRCTGFIPKDCSIYDPGSKAANNNPVKIWLPRSAHLIWGRLQLCP